MTGSPPPSRPFYPDHDRWYEVHAYPSPDGISIYFRNVTERKRAEQDRTMLLAVTEQQRRTYRTALSSTPDFYFIFDLDGRFTFANAALLDLWRMTLDEATGKNFFDLGYPPDLAARLQRQIQQVIDTAQPIRDEATYASHLGEREYEYIFVPVLGEGGAVEAVAGSTRRHHRAEADRGRPPRERATVPHPGRVDPSACVDGSTRRPHLLVQPALA